MKVSFLPTWILFSLISAINAEAREHPSEYAVTATHLYQLAKFINWPSVDPMQHNTLYLCAFESDPARDALLNIDLRQIQGREIRVLYINQKTPLSTCNILFMHSNISNDFLKKQYATFAKHKILTIGQQPGFALSGGILQFTLKDNKIAIEINLQAAKDAEIQVHANLIEIASKVYYQRQS
jgi:YfiR/HmsC-like